MILNAVLSAGTFLVCSTIALAITGILVFVAIGMYCRIQATMRRLSYNHQKNNRGHRK